MPNAIRTSKRAVLTRERLVPCIAISPRDTSRKSSLRLCDTPFTEFCPAVPFRRSPTLSRISPIREVLIRLSSQQKQFAYISGTDSESTQRTGYPVSHGCDELVTLRERL